MFKFFKQAHARLQATSPPADCARASRLIPLYVAQDLPARMEQAVTLHLRTCAHCRAQADDYAASRAWLQTGAQVQFEDEFYDGIRAAVLREIKQPQPPAPLFAPLINRRLAYVAASFALFALLGAFAWHMHSQQQHDKMLAAICKPKLVLSEGRPPSSTSIQLTADASDPDGDTLLYTWSTTGGRITGDGPNVTWDLSGVAPGAYTATVEVDDGCGPYRQNRDELALRFIRSGAQRTAVQRSAVSKTLPRLPFVSRSTSANLSNSVTRINPKQPANSLVTPTGSAEVARIEIQTADPNIRIIWLAPQPAAEQPKQEER